MRVSYYYSFWVILLFQIVVVFPLSAQSFFSTVIEGKSRSYLVVQPKGESLNQPLLIVIRSGSIKTLEKAAADSSWQDLLSPSTLVFPLAIGGKWDCDNTTQAANDAQFVLNLIPELYSTFHVNRNKVFLISDEATNCLSDRIYSFKPDVISSTPIVTDNRQAVLKVNSGLMDDKNYELKYQLYQKTRLYAGDEVKDRQDSIQLNTWERRFTIEFHAGSFSLMNIVKTNISDKTRMDISQISNVIGVQITKWMDNSLGWYADLSYLNVASKEDFNFTSSGISGELGFGFIVPLSFGLKYGFWNHPFRPYFLLGSGPMLVSAVGGRITSSGGGVPDPSSISGDITPIVRITSQLTIGSGFDMRLSKRFLLSGQFYYLHSANFESVGKIEAVRGFSTNLSIGFIFGANKSH